MAWFSIVRPHYRRSLSMLIVALLVGVSSSASAESFRISTKIYVGEEGKKDTQLVSESTTLFLDNVVYDFLADGSQTAVFRKPANQDGLFILLNPDERIRTELTTAQVTGAMQKLRTWAAKQHDPMLQFAANPKFEENYLPSDEPDSGRLVLASHLETYTVTTKPVEHVEATAKYREFLHWYTQLNTLLHPGPPPEPRLRLNEALARHRVLPQTVQLTRAGEDKPLRAVHEFTMRLSRDDEQRIDEVHTSLASFRKVENEEFLKAGQAAGLGAR